MNSAHKPVSVPPLLLDRFDEFMEYAKGAALVTYSPEYFRSPFLDDPKRLRRVILHAVGVRVDGLPLTFKYIVDAMSQRGMDTSDITLQEILSRFEAGVQLVRGTIETEHSLGEALMTGS